MNFGYIVYKTSDFQKALIAEGKNAKTDFRIALRQSSAILEKAIKMTTPNSRTSGRTSRESSDRNRAKWGILKKSVGKYDTKDSRLKVGESAGINVGYLKSKQDKYFIARFLDSGAYNVRSGRVEQYYRGYVRTVEKITLPAIKAKFENVLNDRISTRLNKFANRWTKL